VSNLRPPYDGVQGVSPLRVVRGSVVGATGALYTTGNPNPGFTCVRNADGDYTITFTPPFGDIPTVVAMCGPIGTAAIIKTYNVFALTSSSWRLAVLTTAGSLADQDFHLIAIGPA
jgi:hypothetical protein